VIKEGGQGVVEMVLHVPSNKLFALKVIRLDLNDSVEATKQQQQLSLEVQTLIQSESKYVVKFYQAFCSEGQIQILLEYMDGGSLLDLYKQAACIPEPYLAKITWQILQGLLYLHKTQHIVHRDIKPSNILANRRGRIKIADFGVAKKLDNQSMAKTFVGTRIYLPPERILPNSGYGYSSDIWSLGVTLVECAIGRYPYVAETFFELLACIVKSPPIQKWLRQDTFSSEFVSFISCCMRIDPKERWSAEKLLTHNWIKKYERNEDIDLAGWVVSHSTVRNYDVN